VCGATSERGESPVEIQTSDNQADPTLEGAKVSVRQSLCRHSRGDSLPPQPVRQKVASIQPIQPFAQNGAVSMPITISTKASSKRL
jgi:hypothetical protein